MSQHQCLMPTGAVLPKSVLSYKTYRMTTAPAIGKLFIQRHPQNKTPVNEFTDWQYHSPSVTAITCSAIQQKPLTGAATTSEHRTMIELNGSNLDKGSAETLIL